MSGDPLRRRVAELTSSGRRLFNEGLLPATMQPVDIAVTDLGIVLGTNEPAGPVVRGEM